MKPTTYFILFAFIVISSLAHSQNWAPITVDEKFHYKANGSNVITHTIHADSISELTSGVALFFNRVAELCDTCQSTDYGIDPDLCPANDCFYKREQAQFLMRQAFGQSNGNWLFGNPETFELHTMAGLGESWSYQTLHMATVTDVSTTMIFGVQDSVKTIEYSNGRTFVLSKGHGLLSITDDSGHYELAGIEGRDVGENIPRFDEIFDFEVGDVFEYRSYFGIGAQGYHTSSWYKLTVESVLEVDEGIEVQYNKVHQTGSGSIYWPISDFVFGEETVIETYLRADFSFLEKDLREFVQPVDELIPASRVNLAIEANRSLVIHGGGHLYTIPESDEEFLFPSAVLTSIGGDESLPYFGVSSPTTASEAYDSWIDTPYHARSFGEGIGRFFSYSNNFFEYENYEVMMGFVKGEDTTGVVTADDIILSIEDDLVSNRLQMYPNPANENFDIQIPNAGEYQLDILDLSGREVRKESSFLNEGLYRIDSSTWEEGIYHLRLRTDVSTWIGRLVKY